MINTLVAKKQDDGIGVTPEVSVRDNNETREREKQTKRERVGRILHVILLG